MTQQIFKRGLFVVFEGIDKCGKTTHSKALYNKLKKTSPCQLFSFPNRQSQIGSLINQYLKSQQTMNLQVQHLLFSANRWEAKEGIEKFLLQQQHIICDRYSYSGQCYSSAQGLDLEWCKQTEKGLPKPDIVFYLRIPEEVRKIRLNNLKEKEKFENDQFQFLVDYQYEKIKKQDWIQLDTSECFEKVEQSIFQLFNDKKNELQSLPIGYY